jgi:hypothetical protein
MRKLCVLLCTIVGFACIGCGTDHNEALISQTISTLRDTTRTIEQVKSIVGDAVTSAKKDNKPLPMDQLENAKTKVADLKGWAKQLQRYKALADSRKETIPPEKRKEYAALHKDALQSALVDIDKAQKELETALNEADAVANATADADDRAGQKKLAELREALKEAQHEFEVLTKRQT